MQRLAATLAIASLAATWGAVIHAETFQAGLTARLDITGLDGSPLAAPQAGAPFRIALTLTDATADKPAENLRPSAWLRPVATSNLPCLEAARAFRATGRLPLGAVDLNGILLGIVHADRTFSLVDPKLDLATSNIISMTPLERIPDSVLAEPGAQRFLLVDQATGAVTAIAPGAATAKAAVPARGQHVLSAGHGRLWVAAADQLSLVDTNGSMRKLPLDAAPLALSGVDRQDAPDSDALLLTAGGQALLARSMGGESVFKGPSNATAVAYAATAESVVFVDGGAVLHFAWAGDPAMTAVPLPAPSDRVAVSPDSRFALAWSTKATAVTIIDVATATVVQAASFDRPVREIAFAAGSAFLLLDDLSFVMVLDLAQAAPGAEPAIRAVRLGPGTALSDSEGPFLASLAPAPQVLALHAPTQTAFVVTQQGGNATAPMSAIRIKGGRPVGLHLLDRSVRETAPGRYETVASAAGGRYELVMTTGIGGLSACFPVLIEGEAAPRGLALALRLEPLGAQSPGLPLKVKITAVDATGETIRLPDGLPFVVMAMTTGWRETVVSEGQPDGTLVVLTRPPGAGLYPVIIAYHLPRGVTIAPAILDVSP